MGARVDYWSDEPTRGSDQWSPQSVKSPAVRDGRPEGTAKKERPPLSRPRRGR